MNIRRLPLLLLVMLFADGASAQQRIETTTEVSRSISSQGFSRDFWFTMVENYELQGGGAGKYYEMYIASPQKTDVRVALGKATEQKFPVGAMKVLVFRIPLAWEMTQSGEVESKGIHVWSNDADLTVFLLSRNPATSDGMRVLPTISWGKHYIVASFHSYAYLSGYELPSEFAIVANEDNTVVEITPSTDLRHGHSTAVAYPRGKKFTVTLNKGDAVQYQNSAANGQMTGYDVTGTILTGNKPFGVVAGNMCANIPAEYPYCDHICDMMLPVDRWGKMYHSVPFQDRKGGDAFRAIAIEDNTTIMRYRGDRDSLVFCILNKGQHFIRHDIKEPSMWRSDKPFMLVQYCNSTDFPDPGTNNGIGDPSMMVLSPMEYYNREVLFQTPSITTGSAFKNYVNVVVKESEVGETFYDDRPIRSRLASFPAIQGYQVFQASNVAPGSHIVRSPSGVGVQVYGYGSYDSYAWPGDFGGFADLPFDTVAPSVTSLSTDCFTADVTVADSGKDRSAYMTLSIDSASNVSISDVTYHSDNKDNLSYRIAIVDSSIPAYIEIVVADNAGNRRHIIHTYVPALPIIQDSIGIIRLPLGGDSTFSIAVSNPTSSDIILTNVSLLRENDFEIVDGVDVLAAGTTDSITIRYSANAKRDSDTLLISEGCSQTRISLTGIAYGFIVQDTIVDFDSVHVGKSSSRTFEIFNIGGESFSVQSINLEDSALFEVTSPTSPRPIESGSSLIVQLKFAPNAEGEVSSKAMLNTNRGSQIIHLIGVGTQPASVKNKIGETLKLRAYPTHDKLIVNIHGFLEGSRGSLRIIDLAGKTLWQTYKLSKVCEIEANQLVSGSYIIECQIDGGMLVEKISIVR